MLKAFFNKHPKIHPRRQFRAGVFARLTWWIRQEPRFMLIGAGKCGTTSLEKYITQHPAVEPTVVKELHYFDYMYDHGHDWYRSHFPLVFSKKNIRRLYTVISRSSRSSKKNLAEISAYEVYPNSEKSNRQGILAVPAHKAQRR